MTRPHSFDPRRRGGSLASVVSDFQHVRSKCLSPRCYESAFDGVWSISDKERGAPPIADAQDEGIVVGVSPGRGTRAGSQNLDGRTADSVESVAECLWTADRNVASLHEGKQRIVDRTSAFELPLAIIPYFANGNVVEGRQETSHMIGMWV